MGYNFLVSLVFGGALSVTAEAISVKVLMDLNSLNTMLGAIIVAAGAIDDIFEVAFLGLVVVLGHGGGLFDLALIPVQLAVFFVVAYISFKVISKVLHHMEENGDDETELQIQTAHKTQTHKIFHKIRLSTRLSTDFSKHGSQIQSYAIMNLIKEIKRTGQSREQTLRQQAT